MKCGGFTTPAVAFPTLIFAARSIGQYSESVDKIRKKALAKKTRSLDLSRVRWNFHKTLDRQTGRQTNKAGYTATLVACGWARVMMKKVNQAFGQKL